MFDHEFVSRASEIRNEQNFKFETRAHLQTTTSNIFEELPCPTQDSEGSFIPPSDSFSDKEEEDYKPTNKGGRNFCSNKTNLPVKRPARAPKKKEVKKKRYEGSNCKINKSVNLVEKEQETATVVSDREDKVSILERVLDKIVNEYVDLQKGQTIAEVQEVLSILIPRGLMIIDCDFGDSRLVLEHFQSLIDKGLLTEIHEPTDNMRRSKWFGTTKGNVQHALSILEDSPFLKTFLEQVLGSTRCVVVNFFGQYYLPSEKRTAHLNGHFAYHQDKFHTHYRLMNTFGDSPAGKKMTFSIMDVCGVKSCEKNTGKEVTLNIPHGRTVLLPRYVGGVDKPSRIWHKVYNCEHTLTLTSNSITIAAYRRT